jgi:hypothetical protein
MWEKETQKGVFKKNKVSQAGHKTQQIWKIENFDR